MKLIRHSSFVIRHFAALTALAIAALPIFGAPPAQATDLSYSTLVPQTTDSDVIIAHKQAVAIATMAALTTGQAGEAHLGEVGGSAITLSPTVTVSTSPAYTSGDVVGSKLTLTSAMRVSSGTGVLDSIYVQEKGSNGVALDILIFNADPSNGTYTDNGAFTANDTDMAMCIARVHVATTDYVATGGYTSASLGSLGKVVAASGSANLYAVIITGGTPTYSATTSLKVRFGFRRN